METEIEELYIDVMNFAEIFTQLDDEHKAAHIAPMLVIFAITQ